MENCTAWYLGARYMLANGGLLSAEASFMTLDMLRDSPRPVHALTGIAHDMPIAVSSDTTPVPVRCVPSSHFSAENPMIEYRKLCLAAGALLLAACTAAPVAPAPDGATPAIELRPGGPGEWQATYALAAPARVLRFTRNPGDSRRPRWRLPEDFEITRTDDVDRLRRRDGRPFTAVTLSVPARYVVLPKDYAPFSPFTDGALLVHTGQFHACAGEADCPGEARWALTVVPPEGMRTIVHGAIGDRASFADGGDGTNVYVGAGAPLASPEFVAVIDRGLPEPVRAALYRLLPPLMQEFGARLTPPPATPMLFASLDPYPPSGSGFSHQGGTLPGQVFVHLYGEDWARATEQQVGGHLPWFFAHEAAHLFQHAGEGRATYSMEQSWIHEGGADAFAALSVARFGDTREYVEKRVGKAVGQCAKGLRALGGRPLNASAAAGAFDNYYQCGLLMQLAIDAEVRRASAGKRDLFDVWADFLGRVRAGATWQQDEFLAAARRAGAAGSVEFSLALATQPQPDPEPYLRAQLARAGVKLR